MQIYRVPESNSFISNLNELIITETFTEGIKIQIWKFFYKSCYVFDAQIIVFFFLFLLMLLILLKMLPIVSSN